MPNASERLPLIIAPDARAYIIIWMTSLPLVGLWLVVWLRRGQVAVQVMPIIAAIFVFACAQLGNKAIRLSDWQITQGFPPFRTKIPYSEIARIHRVHISTRYSTVVCLAISAVREEKRIVLPVKSFGAEKRKQLIQIVQERAPQACTDPGVTA